MLLCFDELSLNFLQSIKLILMKMSPKNPINSQSHFLIAFTSIGSQNFNSTHSPLHFVQGNRMYNTGKDIGSMYFSSRGYNYSLL